MSWPCSVCGAPDAGIAMFKCHQEVGQSDCAYDVAEDVCPNSNEVERELELTAR